MVIVQAIDFQNSYTKKNCISLTVFENIYVEEFIQENRCKNIFFKSLCVVTLVFPQITISF